MWTITACFVFFTCLFWGCYYGAYTSKAAPETRIILDSTTTLWIYSVITLITINLLILGKTENFVLVHFLLSLSGGVIAGFGIGRTSYLIKNS